MLVNRQCDSTEFTAMLPLFIVSMITLSRLQDALLPVLNLEAVNTASSSSSPSMGTAYVVQMYDTAHFCYGSD